MKVVPFEANSAPNSFVITSVPNARTCEVGSTGTPHTSGS
jgi:hypothetical protein